jgi:hypothetical protein
MADAFDPYYVWLGIPPEEQPADHYRLLGLRRYEASAAVIDNAADRAMGHLRSVATGKHGPDAQRLLNELAAARVCLLSDSARAKYDAELRAKLAPPAGERMRFTPPPVPGPPAPATARPIAQPIPVTHATIPAAPAASKPTSDVSTSLHRVKSRPSFVAPVVTFFCVVVFGLIGYTTWQNRERELVRMASDGEGQEKKEQREEKPGERVPRIDRKENSPIGTKNEVVPPTPPKVEERNDKPVKDPKPPEMSETPEMPLDMSPETPEGSEEIDPSVTIPAPETNPPPQDFASVAQRAAVPSAEELDARKKQIRDLFRAEFARTKPAELVATARMLLDHARNTKDDMIGKYALLDSALDLAVDNGDVNLSKEIVLDIITFYDVDSLKLKAETLLELGRATLVPAMKHVYFQGAWPVVRELMEGERYEFVPRLAGLLLPIAQLYKDRQLIQDVKDAERDARELREAYEPLQPLVDRLAKSPDDPEACAALGKFRCFHAGDWARGLPLLAKGNETALAKLAGRDLASPTDGKAQMELGDGWRELAKSAGGTRQELEVNERAAYWYGRARESLGGLDAAKVTQSLNELTRKPRHHVDAQKFGQHWYKVFHDKVDWYTAKQRCEVMGGYLVCIETKDEAIFAHRILGHMNRKTAGYWLGLTKDGGTEYRWINGSPLTFSYWMPGSPDNREGNETCGELTPQGFNDLPRDGMIGFVCEWEN